MSERILDTQRCEPNDISQCMSVHTRKITDSCRDKDCIEDLRVYLTVGSQNLLDSAANIRVRKAELLNTYIDVEPMAFDRNHYCIDITFYYRVLADAIISACRPATLYGCATFTKRVVLCGEDSKAHIYRSDTSATEVEGIALGCANRPVAVVEVLDPMVLGSKVKDACPGTDGEAVTVQIPAGIRGLFDEELVIPGGNRRLFVTLGQFSIVRLERDAQLVIPVLEYSIPTRECCDSVGCTDQDPCEMFSRIPFPAQQFSPRSCDEGQDQGGGCCGS